MSLHGLQSESEAELDALAPYDPTDGARVGETDASSLGCVGAESSSPSARRIPRYCSAEYGLCARVAPKRHKVRVSGARA